jgi:hypothetical protein
VRSVLLPTTIVAGIVFLTGCGITKEYHQTYALPADGRIVLETVTGGAQIVGWDREEVKVSVIATASSSQNLQNTAIRIEPGADSIRLWTEPVDVNLVSAREAGRPGGPASVQYLLNVPRTANLERVEVFDSDLEIVGVLGNIRARVRGGDIRAFFDRLGDEITTVNLECLGGSISIRLPPRPDVQIDAHASGGEITSAFGIPLRSTLASGGQYSDLREIFGDGRVRMRLNTTDGGIRILEAPSL